MVFPLLSFLGCLVVRNAFAKEISRKGIKVLGFVEIISILTLLIFLAIMIF